MLNLYLPFLILLIYSIIARGWELELAKAAHIIDEATAILIVAGVHYSHFFSLSSHFLARSLNTVFPVFFVFFNII